MKNRSINKCLVCCNDTVVEYLDAGLHPISNRYVKSLNDEELYYRIVLGQCNICGLVQLTKYPAFAELVPYFDWVTFNEPEEHLDKLVETICTLPGITKDSKICGLSYKEDSTLARFDKRGYSNTFKLDVVNDLGIDLLNAGIETIQGSLDKSRTKIISQKYGRSDIVIARHILEHTYTPLTFMEALRSLVTENGYIIFEIPDCTSVFDSQDYSTIWEEHLLYFTTETFLITLAIGGFKINYFKIYPYPYENSIIAIVQVNKIIDSALPPIDVLMNEKKRMKYFASGIKEKRNKLLLFLSTFQNKNGKIAIYGAGHLSCMFINIMGIANLIEFVVDDHPKKIGLFMPGSKIPIYSSDKLISKNIKLCLTSLSPESEYKVLQNNKDYLLSGGQFFSIFPTSNTALSFIQNQK